MTLPLGMAVETRHTPALCQDMDSSGSNTYSIAQAVLPYAFDPSSQRYVEHIFAVMGREAVLIFSRKPNQIDSSSLGKAPR